MFAVICCYLLLFTVFWFFSVHEWYYSCMESECPDPFPNARGVPWWFEVEECRCCGGTVYYFGIVHLPGGPYENYYGFFDPGSPGVEPRFHISHLVPTRDDFCRNLDEYFRYLTIPNQQCSSE